MSETDRLNPILKADYPDPDVIRVGDTYYMISTTMYFMPGGVILRSYDLAHWEIVSYVFEQLDGTPEQRLEGDGTSYGKGMWAPSLRYHNGRFYVAFVSHGREDTHLFVADNICGPWEHRHINEYFHDCSLLFDDDGRIFIVSGNTNIRLTEMLPDLSAVKPGGIDRIIVRDNPDEVNLGYEGAHFYKIKGRYVLTLIHWPKYNSRRTEAVFTCDTVDGEYRGGDVMWDDMGYHNMGVAQGGLVDTPDGLWYAILFQDSGAVGRVPVLMPVTITESDEGLNFEFGDKGIIPVNPKLYPTRENYSYEPLYTSRMFRDGKPMPQWQFNHVPDNSLWRAVTDDKYCIKTNSICVNPVHAKNTLTQRMVMPGCSAEITVDCSGLRSGDIAGLIALQGRYCMLGITKEDNRYYLIRLARTHVEKPYSIGFPDNEPGEVQEKIMLPSPVAKLKITADFHDMHDSLDTFCDFGEGWKKIGEEHKLGFGLDHFTGARFGLCMFSTLEYGGEAVFSGFSYSVSCQNENA